MAGQCIAADDRVKDQIAGVQRSGQIVQVTLEHGGALDLGRRAACWRNASASWPLRANVTTPPSGARRSASQVSKPLPALRSSTQMVALHAGGVQYAGHAARPTVAPAPLTVRCSH